MTQFGITASGTPMTDAAREAARQQREAEERDRIEAAMSDEEYAAAYEHRYGDGGTYWLEDQADLSVHDFDPHYG